MATRKRKRNEPKERGFVCSFEKCGKSFKRNYHLRRHYASMHGQSNSHICGFIDCEKAFATKEQLNRHEKRHSKIVKPVIYKNVCPEKSCQKICASRSKLLRHLSVHAPKQIICSEEDCFLTFEDKFTLWQHVKLCHPPCIKKRKRGEVPTKRVYCPFDNCGKSFSRDPNLRLHIRAFHVDVLPFSCVVPDCQQAFGHKHVFNNHLRVVHGNGITSSSSSSSSNFNLNWSTCGNEALYCQEIKPTQSDDENRMDVIPCPTSTTANNDTKTASATNWKNLFGIDVNNPNFEMLPKVSQSNRPTPNTAKEKQGLHNTISTTNNPSKKKNYTKKRLTLPKKSRPVLRVVSKINFNKNFFENLDITKSNIHRNSNNNNHSILRKINKNNPTKGNVSSDPNCPATSTTAFPCTTKNILNDCPTRRKINELDDNSLLDVLHEKEDSDWTNIIVEI